MFPPPSLVVRGRYFKIKAMKTPVKIKNWKEFGMKAAPKPGDKMQTSTSHSSTPGISYTDWRVTEVLENGDVMGRVIGSAFHEFGIEDER